jgi:anti-sigma factor RsiW
MKKITCKDVYRHVCEHLDEDLRSPKCIAIRRHLRSCPGCKAYLASIKKTVSLYRRQPIPRMSSSLHRQLYRTLEATMLSKHVRGGRRQSTRPRSG